MSSAQVQISQLPSAGAITGTELVPIVQNGQTVQTTTGAISASPSQTQTFLTKNQEPTLNNSRFLSSGTGVGLVDGGAQSFYRITLNGVSGTLETMGNGFAVKVGGTMTPRTISYSGAGIDVTNGDGQSGNPTIALTGTVASLANSSGTGFLALPGNGTVSGRTFLGTADQVGVTNGDGSSGNPTFSIVDNPVLPGVEGLTVPSGTTAERPSLANDGEIRYNTDLGLFEGYVNGVWASFAAGSGVTSVATGTGLTGGPITVSGTISIANTAVTAGSYGGAAKTLSATVNAQGQLTALSETNIAIANTQISGLGTMSTQNASGVAITGGTINATSVGATTPSTGAFTSVAMTTGTITTAPTSGTDIVNKTYADAIASGIHFHESVNLATTAALPANTYNNGTSGVGATLTGNANGALSVDSTLTIVAERVLIKNEVTQANNGVYTVTQVGSAGTPYILTRATDFDSVGTGVDQIDEGDFFLVTSGTANVNTAWVQQTPPPITIGSTAIVFQQFSAPITYSAGTGLSESPAYTFNIANTAVTSGSYGSASSVGTFSVNAQGQLTAAASTAIAIAGTQITSGVVAVANGGTGLSTLTAGYIPFGAGTSAFGNSANLFWDNTNSRLGVGTSSPTKTLTISTADQNSARVRIVNTSGRTYDLVSGVDGLLQNGFSIFDFTAGATRFIIDASGNVGIGTTSPASKLDVNGTITATAYTGINGGIF
jgi:hypothetical protein